MKKDLASDHQTIIRNSPYLIFLMVSTASGKVNKKEVEALVGVLSKPEEFDSSVLTYIADNTLQDAPAIVAEISAQQPNFIEALQELRGVIDTCLEDAYRQPFKQALFSMANKIIESSGGFLGFGGKASKAEKEVLLAIGLTLGIAEDC